jgi:exonuclease SbcC
MIPYELTLRNFMCYRGDVPPLCLDGLHVACLSGDNGAGKSALLDAITWVLWGKARMSDDELITQGESEMMVDLTFELNGQRYRVTRKRKQGKTTRSGKTSAGKSELDVQVHDPQGWRAIGDHTLRDTQASIEQVLRMSYDTFINASFLLQGRADEFTRKAPAERKRVLADILDLHEYDQLEERARRRSKKLKEQIQGLDGAIEILQRDADKRDLYRQQVAAAETWVTSAQTELEQAQDVQRKADEDVRELEGLEKRRTEVQDLLKQRRAEQQERQQEMADLRQQLEQDEVTLQRRAEIEAGVQALAAAYNDLERLDNLRPRYDDLREQWRDLQEQLKDEKRKLESERDERRRRASELGEQAGRLPRVRAELERLEGQLAELAPLLDEQGSLGEQRSELADRLGHVNALLRRYTDLAAQVARGREKLHAERDRQKQTLEHLEEQLRDVARWQEELHAVREQQQALVEYEQRLADLRAQEQEVTEQVGSLRARCEQFKQRADEIKKHRELLSDDTATTCPVCGSSLGEHGVATMLAHYDEEIHRLRQQYAEFNRQAKEQERHQQQVHAWANQQEKEVAQLRQGAARADTLQQQLEQAQQWQHKRDDARAVLDGLERRLAEHEYEREAQEALLTLEDELQTLARDIPRPPTGRDDGAWVWLAEQLEQQRKNLAQRQADLDKQLATRPGIERARDDCRRDLEQAQHAAEALPAAEKHAADIERIIEDNDYAHAIRQQGRAVDQQLAELGYTADAYNAARELVRELSHWKDEQSDLKLAHSRVENNQKMLNQARDLDERTAAEIDRLDQEHTQLAEALRRLPDARRHAQQCAQATTERHRHLEAARNDLAEKRLELKKAQEAAEQLEQKQQQRSELVARQEVFRDLADACGKKGVQAMLIETAIPEIEREANDLLGRITDNQMHLTFEMQRSTKKGDTVETLDITIADALGTRTYDAFSGGEATRINLAVRIALSRLLAKRAGASLETLVIDEGMGALDAEGRERFIEAITSVQDDFKRILVITHLDDLKDRFPARIEVTKTNEGSTYMLL